MGFGTAAGEGRTGGGSVLEKGHSPLWGAPHPKPRSACPLVNHADKEPLQIGQLGTDD